MTPPPFPPLGMHGPNASIISLSLGYVTLRYLGSDERFVLKPDSGRKFCFISFLR